MSNVEPTETGPVTAALRWVRFDTSPNHRQPAIWTIGLAIVSSLVLCLVGDWLIAKLGVAVFSSNKGYQHFVFSDYATLTIIGVLGAGIAWPIVTRFCATPRWLLFRMAVLVTAALLLPDLGIFLQGQPGRAVIFLVLMHLAIGIITYNALVRIAPVRSKTELVEATSSQPQQAQVS